MVYDWLNQPGYGSLFLLSILASSIIPLGSEWLLVLMLTNGYSLTLVLATATTGNYLGALTTYLIGVYGGHWLIEKILRISPEQQQRAHAWFHRYGEYSLLLSWLPIVGDPLCLVSGMLGTRFWLFTILVVTGKFLRYAVTAWITLAATHPL